MKNAVCALFEHAATNGESTMQNEDTTTFKARSNTFILARVFHPFSSVATFGLPGLSCEHRLCEYPRWPGDYHRDPVAIVNSADLDTIFRVTQFTDLLDEHDLALVKWSRRVRNRSTSPGDVVIVDYRECEQVYRCENFSWQRL